MKCEAIAPVSVQEIKSITASRELTDGEKMEFKTRGRPLPDIELKQISKSREKMFTRSFNTSRFATCEWMCACEVTRRLYCFPCLLFRRDSVWTSCGVYDLKHLSEKCRHHEEFVHHVDSALDLAMIGNTFSPVLLADAPGYRAEIERHNEQAKRNCYVLSKIVDCIKFCGSFEPARSGGDEAGGRSIFLRAVDFASELDSVMRAHLDNAAVFKGTSLVTMHYELLDCMYQVYREHIADEVQQAKFLAVVAKETTDIAGEMQMAMSLRYETNGRAVERFLGLFNPEGNDAQSLSKCVLEQLQVHLENCTDKLIAQSYEGASEMGGTLGAVQKIVQGVYPYAFHIHDKAEPLTLVMERAAMQNTKARVFFASLREISTFYASEKNRFAAPIWMEGNPTAKVVYENKQTLLDSLQKLAVNPHSCDGTIGSATSLLRTLNDPEFNHWLKFFHDLMAKADQFDVTVKARRLAALETKAITADFISVVKGWQQPFKGPRKRKLEEDVTDTGTAMAWAAKEVYNCVANQVLDRFAFTDHLEIQRLVEPGRFPLYANSFPEVALKVAKITYPTLQKEKLRSELQVLYKRTEFRADKSTAWLLKMMVDHRLENLFGETFKLLRILVTMPGVVGDEERSPGTMERTRDFLRNVGGRERLGALAVLSVEREMVAEMKDFNERVISKFVLLRHRRADFALK